MPRPATLEGSVHDALDIVRRRIRAKRAGLFSNAEASALDHLDKLTRS